MTRDDKIGQHSIIHPAVIAGQVLAIWAAATSHWITGTGPVMTMEIRSGNTRSLIPPLLPGLSRQ
jgi:hypothetical protein